MPTDHPRMWAVGPDDESLPWAAIRAETRLGAMARYDVTHHDLYNSGERPEKWRSNFYKPFRRRAALRGKDWPRLIFGEAVRLVAIRVPKLDGQKSVSRSDWFSAGRDLQVVCDTCDRHTASSLGGVCMCGLVLCKECYEELRRDVQGGADLLGRPCEVFSDALGVLFDEFKSWAEVSERLGGISPQYLAILRHNGGSHQQAVAQIK